MAYLNEITKLDNYEDEEIFDVVIKLEKSFGLKFNDDAFYNVKTFGDMCDVFKNEIKYEERDDCTKQQAFYRIRNAIVTTQSIERSVVNPDTKLEDLFPRHNRRLKVKEFKKYLGPDIDILTYPGWLAFIFGIGFLLSLIALFFYWKIAVAGIVFFIIAMKIANKLGKDFEVKTIRDLAEKLSEENYNDVRRTKNTVNRQEVLPIIIDTFSKHLAIDKIHLTRDAKFSWTT